MQVAVSKRDLLRVLARCQGVADKKSTMPVLGNVLLEVNGTNSLRLAATDLFLAVSGHVPAEVDKGGSIAVGARDLYERVKMMPEGQVTLASNDAAALVLRASGSARRYTLHGIPGEEFPSLPAADASAKQLSLPAELLSRLIGATHFSISTDETRPHLNSALFEWEGQRVRMVTTDGHRLSKMEVDAPGAADASSVMLIPLKGIQELRRLCDEARADDKAGESNVELAQSGPNAFFRVGSLQFSVKLVDAQFPPYQQVIPSNTERAIIAPRGAVADALKAVSVAASDRTGGVKLTMTENLMRFSSESPESGDGFDEISVDYNAGDLTIGFNAKYLLDVLAAIESDDVELGISGELDPVVVKRSGSSGDEYLAVIMPMRI